MTIYLYIARYNTADKYTEMYNKTSCEILDPNVTSKDKDYIVNHFRARLVDGLLHCFEIKFYRYTHEHGIGPLVEVAKQSNIKPKPRVLND